MPAVLMKHRVSCEDAIQIRKGNRMFRKKLSRFEKKILMVLGQAVDADLSEDQGKELREVGELSPLEITRHVRMGKRRLSLIPFLTPSRTLKRLEQKGYIEGRLNPLGKLGSNGKPYKIYRITELGLSVIPYIPSSKEPIPKPELLAPLVE